jgi:pimeloyl-ACP methyl ester carboxylesterase
VTVVVDAAFIETARGARCRVAIAGPPEGDPVVLLHSALGPAGQEAFMSRLADAGLHVFAPELPGYGESTGEDLLEDMLDFTLHAWDVVDALGIDHPVLIGHSMGGMIAAEMAAVSNIRPAAVVLVAPTGLWNDDCPIPDLFSLLPFQFAPLLFADEAFGASLLTGGLDFGDVEALRDFLILNARRLGTAGKILFPIPNRRLSKRLYRLQAPTLLVWGGADRYHPPVYAERWHRLIPHAEVVMFDDAAHMIPHEQPGELAAEIARFLAAPRPAGTEANDASLA